MQRLDGTQLERLWPQGCLVAERERRRIASHRIRRRLCSFCDPAQAAEALARFVA